MSGKDKLKKFRENETFDCLIQPKTEDIIGKEHPLKGKWGTEIFRNNNPIILELGCGKGEYTIALALKNPEKNFIGIDIKGARLWKGAKYAHLNKLSNVAFLRTRIDFIESVFDKNEISEIWITFADPQPKKPCKRLTSPVFLNKYIKFLKKEGTVHLKTDSLLLHKYTMETASKNKLTIIEHNTDIYGSARAEGDEILSVKTFYETRFLANKMPITYMAFKLDTENEII